MSFSALWRLKYMYSSPPMDNFAFRLCYRWTTLLLIAFSFVITCRLLFGDSFVCTTDDENNFSPAYLNSKCYENTVYTRPTKLIIKGDESLVMDPYFEDFRRYQFYYSWVNLLFLVHAFNFYLPHLLWKSYEKGYMHRLTAGVQKFFDGEEKRDLELCYLAKYVLVTQGRHKVYALTYISLEVCNYAISLAQTLWLVHFFDVTGVPDFLPYILGTWSDFGNFYFPSEGLCELQIFSSPSGSPSVTRALCQLPLNSLYQKLFLFLYAWYILVTVSCGLVIVYRIALLVPRFRMLATKKSSALSEGSVLASVCHRLSYSDWFFLSRLQKSMVDIDFAQMVDKISVVSQGRDPLKDNGGVRLSLYEDAAKDFSSSQMTPHL